MIYRIYRKIYNRINLRFELTVPQPYVNFIRDP
jgi:hypothetical protein